MASQPVRQWAGGESASLSIFQSQPGLEVPALDMVGTWPALASWQSLVCVCNRVNSSKRAQYHFLWETSLTLPIPVPDSINLSNLFAISVFNIEAQGVDSRVRSPGFMSQRTPFFRLWGLWASYLASMFLSPHR